MKNVDSYNKTKLTNKSYIDLRQPNLQVALYNDSRKQSQIIPVHVPKL